MLGVTALGTLSVAESNDRWCAGCHLPPESTFVARAAGPTAVDLAAAHALAVAAPPLRCIECHGGPGVGGRLSALQIAVHDSWSWLRGDFVAVGTRYAPVDEVNYPIPDHLCADCHAEVVTRPGFENHFHHLLGDPKAPPMLRCVTCHDGHVARPGEPFFLTKDSVAPGCDACHARMGGPIVPAAAAPPPVRR